ncbi:MAG: hypothetical protein E7166_00195 [Firmicutes bacterium]|nr:hypothetical protein [Bacillota bacterium]
MNFKLNNRGWGLSDFLLIGSIIIICLLFSSVMIIRLTNGLKENLRVNDNKTEEKVEIDNNDEETINLDNQTIDYIKLESTLTKDAIKYVEEVYKNNIGENLFIVDYPHLLEVDSNLKTEMSKDNCNGYVESKKNGENIEFTPYLKCDNYSTNGVKDYYLN